MQKRVFTFNELAFGSKLIRDLIAHADSAKTFAGDFFDLEKIEEKIISRKKNPIDRNLLVSVLQRQNQSIGISDLTKQNITSLANENTFTITTGHQLNLLTGPLFSMYKIAQVIVLTEDLKRRFPKYNFVPVFWMATEDHDFEEINHINLFNKKLTWEKTGQDASIAGRIETNSLKTLFEEIELLYQSDDLKSDIRKLASFYLESENLADATRKLVNHFFGDQGLVILDGNDAELKQLLKPVLKQDISEGFTKRCVEATNTVLENAGYHLQVHVRDCNLFFIHSDGKRERIRLEDEKFHFGIKNFSTEELIKMIDENPADFSPNALLRPVYQEIVLPNLAYIGGGGEISYWLQLKTLFENLNVSFPFLRVRDSLFILNQKQADDLEKSELKFEDLQQDIDLVLKNKTLEKHGDALSFSDAEADLLKAKEKILQKVNALDSGLVSMAEAEFSKMFAALEKLESKLVKSAKSKDESARNRILKLKEKFFPNNHFQERHENILDYYLNDKEIIHKILKTIQAENEPKIRILIQ